MKIIFMGTPEFSCPTLEKLILDKTFEIVAIYTKEPKIAGRGHKITNSAIHNLALKNNLKVLTPKTLRNLESQIELKNLQADAIVVVAYGLILPKEILEATRYGCINIHPSLLPKWRGAAPIQRTIMAGDKKTGICIIKMDEGIDSGDILYKEEFDLLQNETYQNLSQKLSQIGADILIKTLKNLRDNKISAIKQDDSKSVYAKKIEKSEYLINWQESVIEIERKIRGLNGCGGAYFNHNGEKIKIFESEIIDENSKNFESGKIINQKLEIQCGSGILKPTKLQREGRKPMDLEEFLLGFKIWI